MPGGALGASRGPSHAVLEPPVTESLDVHSGVRRISKVEELMLSRILMSAGVASAMLLAGAAEAKEKKATASSHVYTQVECSKMKSMHWDDATQSCQKNKTK